MEQQNVGQINDYKCHNCGKISRVINNHLYCPKCGARYNKEDVYIYNKPQKANSGCIVLFIMLIVPIVALLII